MFGGRLWLDSELGRGSTFHFTAKFGLATCPKLLPKPVKLENIPVLVVDDNATNRRILTESLAHWGMKSSVADGGVSALSALEQARAEGDPYPIIILDMQMPSMDGFELAREIRAHPHAGDAKLVMLSSAGQRGDALRCKSLGIDAYLRKPVTQSDLLQCILTVMGHATPDGSSLPLVTRHSLREARRHILLADDSLVNQRLAARLLEKQGHTVVVANNGREAVEAFGREAFDLVLMDVQMPVMNGFEATAEIRRNESRTGKHIQIVALTAHAMAGDRERCLEAGMDAYLSKPIKPEELNAVIA